jgi:hypothetical protein
VKKQGAGNRNAALIERVEAKSFVSENPEEWKMCKSFVSAG